MELLYAVAVIGGLGLGFGLLLAAASKYLAVGQDERIPQIVDVLPNANCGGCGYAGCSAFAAAVAAGKAPVTGCPVGGTAVGQQVARIMGVKAAESEPMTAAVLCCGTTEAGALKYTYDGISDCREANRLGGGQKACRYACLGLGNCVSACPFGAIRVENGIAVVDSEACVGCGKCVAACPKGLIRLLPKQGHYRVICSSRDKGADMKGLCTAGCIGCGICAKNCPAGAITVTDFLAEIDQSKCTRCGLCAEKCPKKIIMPCNIGEKEV